MKYEVLYAYDMWNDKEEAELYNQELDTKANKFSIGERLYMFGGSISRGTAVLTSIEDITDKVKLCRTKRSVHLIEIKE